MTTLYSIDPGTNPLPAIAAWCDCELTQVEFTNFQGLLYVQGSRIVCELPVVYPYCKTPNARSLTELFLQVGEFRAYAKLNDAIFTTLEPRIWKGQTPKQIHRQRIWKALSPAEQRILDVAVKMTGVTTAHNLYDAVGIGLFDLKRIDNAGRMP